jgi:hypothetical protein
MLMNKLIGTALVLLCMMTKTQASQKTHASTLENEHRDRGSHASQLPTDIIEKTKPYLNACPVLTVKSSLLGLISSFPIHEFDNLDKDLKDIEKVKKEVLEWNRLQTGFGIGVYNTKYNYIYMETGVGVYIGKSRKSLKDVLVEYDPKIELKATLVDLDEKPDANGTLCLYEGSAKGKYYFHFVIQFPYPHDTMRDFFNGIAANPHTIRIDD